MTTSLLSLEPDYVLDFAAMDDTHREFIDLLNQLSNASKPDFIALFPAFVHHTQAHFAQEEQWMQDTQFSSIHEHISDHQRVLGDLNRFGSRVAAGNTAMGRAYIREQLPRWFDTHAKTMDSALAAHLKHL